MRRVAELGAFVLIGIMLSMVLAVTRYRGRVL